MKKCLSILLALLFTVSIFTIPSEEAHAKDDLKNTDPEKYYIVLDLNNQVVTVYEKDAAGEYTRIVRQFICSTGRDKPTGTELFDDSTPTPTGVWKIGGRERFGKFANFSEYARYWTQLVEDIYFHSIMFNSRKLHDIKSNPYRALGSSVSHGCIRLLVEDAKWMYYNACPGTTVRVTNDLPTNRALKNALRDQRNETSFKEYKALQENFYDGEELPNDRAWVTHKDAAIRKESKSSGKYIHGLSIGEELEVLLYNDAWVKVRDEDNKEGYVYRGYISMTEGKSDTRENANVIRVTTWMFDRKEAESEYRICKVPTDTPVRVLEIDEALGFAKIEYYTEVGYIRTKYLETNWGIDLGDYDPLVITATPKPTATPAPTPEPSEEPAAATATPAV